jgi:Tfp pilus assembly protein PilF
MALNILETQGDQVSKIDEDHRVKVAKNLETAIVSDRNNPLALKMLADHYFKQKNNQVSQYVCE